MVVSNASPLIALEQIGQLQLIERIFSEILIPPAVAREVASSVVPRSWIATRELRQSVGLQIPRMSLGPGESEAIGLALEVSAEWIILDERPARRVAAGLGLPVIGTLGLLLAVCSQSAQRASGSLRPGIVAGARGPPGRAEGVGG